MGKRTEREREAGPRERKEGGRGKWAKEREGELWNRRGRK
jgi:hypothetical protein